MAEFFDDLNDISSIVDEVVTEIYEPKKKNYIPEILKMAGIAMVAVPFLVITGYELIRYYRIKAAIKEAESHRKE